MVRKLLTKLLIKILKPDIVALTRASLLGKDFNVIEEENLKGAARGNYLAEADLLFHNKVFINITKQRLKARIGFIARETVDWGQVIFGRGGINEIDLLEEEAKRLHALYHEENPEKPKDFDPGEVI